MFKSMGEIITLCKQNMGLRDLPKPISDADLRWRLEHSALKEFSQIYPYIAQFMIGESERLCRPYTGIPTNHTNTYSHVYQIPKHYYQDKTIMAVPNVDIARPQGYNDLYVPQGAIGDPASIITSMASIQMVASMASAMTHSLTWDFRAPDILILYNGWAGGYYEIELAMSHDPTLSTIPPTAFSQFEHLCELDLQEYVYKKLSRIQNLDLGVGSIELKIDDWADAGQRKREFIEELADGCELDTLHIQRY